MGTKLLWTLTFLFIFLTGSSQKNIGMNVSEFELLPGVEKKDVKHLRQAEKHFNNGVDQYRLALPLYLDARPDSVMYQPLEWRLGLCYLHSDQKEKALEHMLNCDKAISLLYYFYLGRAYHFNNDYAKAKEMYQTFISTSDIEPYEYLYRTYDVKRKNRSMTEIVNGLIASCDMAIKNTDVEYVFTPIVEANTTYDEIFPVVFNDSVFLFSSSSQSDVSNQFQIFEGRFHLGDTLTVSEVGFSGRYLTKDDDSRIPLSNSFCPGDSLLFQSMYQGGDIMFSHKNKKGRIKEGHIEHINTERKEGTACLLNDSTMVLSSEKGTAPEKADLFITFRDKRGRWRTPEPIAEQVNSEGREEVITFFNGELYYISNGPGSLGGFDIYKVAYIGKNKWGEPQNLGYPVNTADNDMSFYPIDAGNAIYSGVRKGGQGACDLYWVKKKPVVKTQNNE